ncbi:GNAT family N-acetyltransferase [Rhodococcus erythropolis]|uniref:GNAT family N-acetyltransferase n=1 Tax=Rhodococcus erythropolis TaxID=1833 RepID=UPI00040FCA35
MRHSMNEILADVGGHIGYGVRPPERRQGIASTALQEMLTCATQSVGLGRVLIVRNEMNVGSRKAIEVCGGLLASVRPADQVDRNLGCSRDTLRCWAPTSMSSVS